MDFSGDFFKLHDQKTVKSFQIAMKPSSRFPRCRTHFLFVCDNNNPIESQFIFHSQHFFHFQTNEKKNSISISNPCRSIIWNAIKCTRIPNDCQKICSNSFPFGRVFLYSKHIAQSHHINESEIPMRSSNLKTPNMELTVLGNPFLISRRKFVFFCCLFLTEHQLTSLFF